MIAPESRRKEVIAFCKGGLRDLSVSRTSFQWGVPVPGDDKHIMYVWIDALTNYISALGYPEGRDFEKFWPNAIHVVGKDILRFHAVYWPAMLMAADLPVPKRLFAHGWWTKDGQKISKSIGNIIDPVDIVAKVRLEVNRLFADHIETNTPLLYSLFHSTVSIRRVSFSCPKSILAATVTFPTRP
jgi:methionyl-tRNA synthetase